MKIINSTPTFNPFNNSWVYLCMADDGSMWGRSSAGKWTILEQPVNTFSVAKDFDAFILKGENPTIDDIKADNKGDVVVPVEKAEPPVEPVEPPAEPAEPIVLI